MLQRHLTDIFYHRKTVKHKQIFCLKCRSERIIAYDMLFLFWSLSDLIYTHIYIKTLCILTFIPKLKLKRWYLARYCIIYFKYSIDSMQFWNMVILNYSSFEPMSLIVISKYHEENELLLLSRFVYIEDGQKYSILESWKYIMLVIKVDCSRNYR